MTTTEPAVAEPALDEAVTHVLCCHRAPGEPALCGQSVDTEREGEAAAWCPLCTTIADAYPPSVCPHDGAFCPGERER